MNCEIIERVIAVSRYITSTKKTIRETAKIFNISKSTVHKDVSERLKYVDNILYNEVKKILENHIETRHINGGLSTKKYYENKRLQKINI